MLKIDEQVITIRLNHSGIKEPKRIPRMMAMMSFGISPMRNFFFSMTVPPIIILLFCQVSPLTFWYL